MTSVLGMLVPGGEVLVELVGAQIFGAQIFGAQIFGGRDDAADVGDLLARCD